MENKKNGLLFITALFILILISFQLSSCGVVEVAKGIIGGFQFGETGSRETVSSDEIITDDSKYKGDNNRNDGGGTETQEDTIAEGTTDLDSNSESTAAESYQIVPADRKGMGSKIETEHYIFYFNEINEGFLNTYAGIAEDGWDGLEIIFGEKLDKNIEIFLCESVEEFNMAADNITPPGFDGSQPAGQAMDGAVYIYKAEDFKPVQHITDDIRNYRIALLHEIGHAYYHWIYPNAARKNDWLNEALADKSITGDYIDPNSTSNGLLKDLISGGSFVPLSELESKGDRYPGQGNEIFSEYISFVNYICLEFGFESLYVFLSEYNGSNDFLTSIEVATNMDAGSFENSWLDFIKNGS
jgi:hypothetical protein